MELLKNQKPISYKNFLNYKRNKKKKRQKFFARFRNKREKESNKLKL